MRSYYHFQKRNSGLGVFRLSLFMLMLLCTLIFSLFPSSAFAYTGGLLNTLPMNKGTTTTSASTVTVVTDNDENTSATLQGQNSTTPCMWTSFSSPISVGSYKLKANQAIEFSLYDQVGNVLYRETQPFTTTSPAHTYNLTQTYTNVYKVSICNGYNLTSGMTVWEFDVFNGGTVPPAPTGLTAAPGNGSVSLNWAPNTQNDLKGYNVYNGNTKLTSAPITSTNYVATGFTNGITYNFQVTAVNTGNLESVKSGYASATPVNSTPPSSPTGLNGTQGISSVVINWAANSESDLKGYFVYRNGARLNSTPFSSTSYNDQTGTPGTTYSYQISAVNTSNYESAKSTAINLTSLDGTPPSAPTGFTGTAGNSTVSLSWAANIEANVTGYNVYKDGVKLTSSPTSARSYTVSSLVNGSSYTFQVSAVSSAGVESVKSTSITLTPLNPSSPSVPTGLFGNPQNQGVNLGWTPNGESDIKNYYLYQDGVKIATTSATNYPLTGLTNKTTYGFQVSAVNTSGKESARSASIYVTPINSTPPDEVSYFAHSAVTTNSTVLSFTTPTTSDFSYYKVYKNGVLEYSSPEGTPKSVGVSYNVTSLSPSTTYTYRVTTVNTSGTESVGVSQTFTTSIDTTPPDEVGSPNYSAVTAISASISFVTPATSDFSYYKIYKNGVLTYSSPAGTPKSAEVGYNDNSLSPTTKYTYKITTVDTTGNESVGVSVTFTTPYLDPVPPSTPQDFVLEGTTDTSISFTWSSSTDNVGVSGYYLYKDGVKVTGLIPDTSYTLTNLTRGKSSIFEVTAVDTSSNESPRSTSIMAAATSKLHLVRGTNHIDSRVAVENYSQPMDISGALIAPYNYSNADN